MSYRLKIIGLLCLSFFLVVATIFLKNTLLEVSLWAVFWLIVTVFINSKLNVKEVSWFHFLILMAFLETMFLVAFKNYLGQELQSIMLSVSLIPTLFSFRIQTYENINRRRIRTYKYMKLISVLCLMAIIFIVVLFWVERSVFGFRIFNIISILTLYSILYLYKTMYQIELVNVLLLCFFVVVLYSNLKYILYQGIEETTLLQYLGIGALELYYFIFYAMISTNLIILYAHMRAQELIDNSRPY